MKTVGSLLCAVLLGALIASAQTPSGISPNTPPDIIVLQKNWRLDSRNSLLDEDPFSANAEFNEALRAQRENDIRNVIRAKGSESREPPPMRRGQIKDAPPEPSATYVYQVKVKNTGTKTIRSVDWVYTFLDPETQREMGKHRYSSKVRIRPGQNNSLVGRTASPPTYIVSVKNAGKDEGKQMSEQVVINRIEYEDGTVWQNPSK
jgi:hypothetical protein